MTDINDLAQELTGDWVKLTRKEHGTIEGTVVSISARPLTFEDKAVLNSKTGEQRKEWVLAVREDGGDVVKFSLKEAGQRAVANAIKESGAKAKVGDRIKIGVKEDPPNDRSQPTYQVRWTPTAFDIPDVDPEAVDDTEPPF